MPIGKAILNARDSEVKGVIAFVATSLGIK
jgi:hypothetical protein